ncbi:Crp/Fnr family transcriptional regulator [Sphingomonas sp. M1-B02]|uniref:Crp/Fnr family transcriptional regulator n=1 Tax=Sphingomonas sp. M1-B02 TaxID=3114300 RepID=UPI002240BEA4|nr:Crp/Fnr family transcriptional regulator [Sphingomonas sp. S6-11]UZK66702.1 Crp/Fnr family transcriptional regulator [Sphingomonas sp. S6-11]
MYPSQHRSLHAFVHRLTSRSILTEDEINAILALDGHEVVVAAHSDFVRMGEHVDHSCLVVDGLVGRFGQNSNGARQITCLHIPGDMADLPSVVSPKSGWGLAAMTRTKILRVPHAELRRIAAKHPGIAEAFWRDCVADGSIFSEWVVNVGRRDALTRVAHLLCEMAIKNELAECGTKRYFPFPIVQADLGDATGLTTVHVNRTLKELRERSIVTVRSGAVTIHDWDQLVYAGDFDVAFMLLDGPSPRIAASAGDAHIYAEGMIISSASTQNPRR